MMGNEIFLYLLMGEKPFLARVDPRTKARPGQEIQVVFNMAKMHAFDPATEKNILVSPAPVEVALAANPQGTARAGHPTSSPPPGQSDSPS